jgi:hypothetical protein
LTDVANQPPGPKRRIQPSLVLAVVVIVIAWIGMIVAAIKFIARGMPH